MGCVSSTLLSQEDEFTHIGAAAASTGGTAAFAHHIVYLKSTTYGLLTLDPPPPLPSYEESSPPPPTTTIAPTPPPRFTLSSASSDLITPFKPSHLDNDIINSWELMAGLDSSTPPPFAKPSKENSNPNLLIPSPLSAKWRRHYSTQLDGYEKLCPPNGENKLVIYTTTLRGIRKTFEDCNAVRSAIQGLGFSICERDISMDRGFREELRELVKGKPEKESIPPRVFVRGRYIGGAEEVLRLAEEEEEEEEGKGGLRNLLSGLPKMRGGMSHVCEGCGGVRFLPCFKCNGSCKMVFTKMVAVAVAVEEGEAEVEEERSVVVRCSECNENGLVLCPICS